MDNGRGWDHTMGVRQIFPRGANGSDFEQHAATFTATFQVTSARCHDSKGAGTRGNYADGESPGGEIEHDAKGQPDGMLKEGPGVWLGRQENSPDMAEQRRKGIELAPGGGGKERRHFHEASLSGRISCIWRLKREGS